MDEDDEFAYYEMTQVILNMQTYERDADRDDKVLMGLYISACERAQKALKERCEAQEYRTPKKPSMIGRSGVFACPACGKIMAAHESMYCSSCGQAIEWED